MGRLLFVYGTLKRGYGNHHIIKDNGGKFVDTVSAQKHVFIDTHGAFPYMVQSDDWAHMPEGEMYEFPDATSFKDFDDLEVPAGYTPVLIDTVGTDGDYNMGVTAYVYTGVYYDGTFVRRMSDASIIKVNAVTSHGQWHNKVHSELSGLFGDAKEEEQ